MANGILDKAEHQLNESIGVTRNGEALSSDVRAKSKSDALHERPSAFDHFASDIIKIDWL